MAGEIENEPITAALDLDNSEEYDSAEDEDFQLDEAGGADEDSGLSSSEDEAEEAGGEDGRPAKRRKVDKTSSKKQKAPGETMDQMELDSGDEATIRKAKAKKNKSKTKGKVDEDEDDDIILDEDDEGGVGGFVKTRSMRMKIQEDRKPLAKVDGATIDVDAIWAEMNAPDSQLGLLPTSKPPATENADEGQEASTDQDKENNTAGKQEKLPSEDMIKIKRTYKFAGEMHTEEKLVPRDSAEAKLYLAEKNNEKSDETDSQTPDGNAVKLRRPLRKISRFDPNPTGAIKKSWEKQATAVGQEAKGPKLNTVEKSRLDWAQYVDEEGIKDELNVHSKAKEGYLGRMDFLGRVEAKREEERRNIRLRGL